MSIFQKSVISKHLKNLDKEQVELAYHKFRDNYSLAKIEKIKELKEEEYQDGFLRDIFVDVLGYTLKPDENYNLVREYKNRADSKKADGAIVKAEEAIAVIELKSTRTKDLKNITEQAFNYKNNQPGCKYVITSNFRMLRFYIDYAGEYEEFDLFNLQKSDFSLLYLILSKKSICTNLPSQLREESVFHEQNISNNLYKDYSQFKQKLFENLIKNNPEFDKLTLFKKSQKLLDRFLFILFAEDGGLLPPNSISRIIKRYNILRDEDAYKPLYDIYKQFFGYLNTGRSGKVSSDDIPAYSGGLFSDDEILNSLIIEDNVLIHDLLQLSKYDFNTEVDVNILGHIFEHSLNEMEDITAEIEGASIGKVKSKRKRDGVFYTPKYITQYIVDNTLGTLCNEKRGKLEIEEIEFDKTYQTKDGRLSAKGKKLFNKLNDYKNWLLDLKIVDPACGSGAFLNQALNFLIDEHKSIDNIITELTGDAIRLFDTDKTILENNLYGVDINDESVEIAKLSLWLRTAVKGRKLSNLNDNIKCGNSLIDDAKIAGSKAFNWGTEFPQVFKFKKSKLSKSEIVEIEKKPDYLLLIEQNAELARERAEQSVEFAQEAMEYSKKVQEFVQKQKSIVSEAGVLYSVSKGGFDVVIGNPPYVRAELLSEFQEYFSQNYSVYNPSGDLFSYFYERSFKLLKAGAGMFGFISNVFDKTTAGISIREYLQNETSFIKYVDFTQVQIFEGATTYPVIIIARNIKNVNNTFKYIKIPSVNRDFVIDIDSYQPVIVEQKSLNRLNWSFKGKDELDLILKLKKNKTVREKYGKCYYGIKTGLNEAFIIPKVYKVGDHVKPILEGRELSKWRNSKSVQQLILFESRWTKKEYGDDITEAYGLQQLSIDYPKLLNHILPFVEKAKKRYDKGDFFWELRNCAYYNLFEQSKIIFPNLQKKNKFSFDETGAYVNAPAVILPTKDKFLTAILNSRVVWYFLKNICVVRSGGYIEVKPQYFEQIPIPEIINKEKLELMTDTVIESTSKFQKVVSSFNDFILSQFGLDRLSNKLKSWHLLSFGDFIKELNKAIKKNGGEKPAKKEELEWMELFEQRKTDARNLMSDIEKTEIEIDRLVYKLYDLNNSEITIIEKSINEK